MFDNDIDQLLPVGKHAERTALVYWNFDPNQTKLDFA